MFNVKRKI